MAETYTKGSIYQLDLTSLQPDPAQARKFIDPASLAELTASVGKYGVLQPILFRQDEPGAPLFIVAGERRVEACWAAGLTTIPGIFVSGKSPSWKTSSGKISPPWKKRKPWTRSCRSRGTTSRSSVK